MIRQRILYLLLLGFTLYNSLLYIYRGLRFLLAVLLLLPLALFLQVFFGRFRCRMGFREKEITCVRGEENTVELVFDNRGLLPVSCARVWILWKTPEGGKGKIRGELRQIAGKEKQSLVVNLPSQHCGQVFLYVKKGKIYDYTGLCSMTLKRPSPLSVLVLPRITPLEIGSITDAMLPGRIIRKGTGDLEEYEIRSYQPGDSLHRIHWKLSVREEELQIRDYESDRCGGTAVFLELPAEGKQYLDQRDRYFDKAVSLLVALFYASCGLKQVGWMEAGEYRVEEICREEDIHACILHLLAVAPKGREGKSEGGESAVPADMLRLTGDLGLYMGEQCIYE